ncbi:hypothetical protein C8J57DRAFT_1458875 [Mycena rebaudengoi]|nr:hypothetical protein C8J57DRAFT_1458875 [Mycena rebaudengoi]
MPPFGFGFGGPQFFGGPPNMLGGLPPDPAFFPDPSLGNFQGPTLAELEASNTGILLNNSNYQVADVQIASSAISGSAVIPNSKGSPIPESQIWTFSPVGGSDNPTVYIKSHVLSGSTNYRFSASSNSMGGIELSEFQQQVWTISIAKDDSGGQGGLVGKSFRIFTSVQGVDMYWTADTSPSPGRIVLRRYDIRDADAQIWTLQG